MPDPDSDALHATLDAFLGGLRARDWERMQPAFAADADVFFPFDDPARRVEGITAVEAVFRAFFATRGGDVDVQPLDLAIRVIGDAALVTFHLDRPGALGRRTLVLRRDAGRWRIAHLHASVTKAPG
jgi:ketosteroid isomerase-like protein